MLFCCDQNLEFSIDSLHDIAGNLFFHSNQIAGNEYPGGTMCNVKIVLKTPGIQHHSDHF